MSEVTEVKEVTVRDTMIATVQEITNCDESQADRLFVTIDGLFVSRLQEMFSDPKVLQDIFLNMQSIQLQNVAKFRNLEPEIDRVEVVVLDEENEYTGIRVNYATEDADTWFFEQRIKGEWSLLDLGEKERLSLVGTAGKFFDGRVERYGYMITTASLDKLSQEAKQ